VADVLRRYGKRFRQAHETSLLLSHKRVLRDIETCRTAALGGHVDACKQCGAREISYNSCRNRHCPKCQSRARRRWLEARVDELLPVEYFHVVFTLPQAIATIGLQNKRCIYNLLFQATAETLRTIAADPKHLGAEIGFLAVLHSWGQTLTFHPHLHCIVPGGGFSPTGSRWISCRPGFFLPVRVLSRLFRRIFLKALDAAYAAGELGFHGSLAGLREPARFARWIEPVRRSEWVVYAKPPFGGPDKVLEYLGRYTHRVAISNHRIVDIADGHVTFRWRDYRHGNRNRTMTLRAEEFIRRFLLHVLPDRFMRIRHFGFLANRNRTEKIEKARQLLKIAPEALPATTGDLQRAATMEDRDDPQARFCPECRQGQLVRIQTLSPSPVVSAFEGIDSS
jgi:hypothetical protein